MAVVAALIGAFLGTRSPTSVRNCSGSSLAPSSAWGIAVLMLWRRRIAELENPSRNFVSAC